MKDDKGKRQESPWVTMARYSEIGFLIPAAVIVGYLLGLLAIFGAVSGFISMIRRAMQASSDEDKEEKTDERH